MGKAPTTSSQVIISAFRAALVHQSLIILGVLAALAVLGAAWRARRGGHPGAASPRGAGPRGAGPRGAGPRDAGPRDAAARWAIAEPGGRRLLRIGFGILWLFDGLLQAQPMMPVRLADEVTVPSAGDSPVWVRHLVHGAGTLWNAHPIAAATAAVWIELGIGAWMLAAPRGTLSRLAGMVGAAWGLVVWVFGEAFGEIFAPGLNWASGAPGAVMFYLAAGVLVALPDNWWAGRRAARGILAAMGAFLTGMAVLQSWPGRGSWQGNGGPLTAMIQEMAQTPQPHFLARLVSGFASFNAAHGVAVNLTIVIVLAATGLALLPGHQPTARAAVAVAWAFCLATWVLAQDLGFFGGVGTDPNSMIPILLILTAGYVALAHPPAPMSAPATPVRPWWEGLKLKLGAPVQR